MTALTVGQAGRRRERQIAWTLRLATFAVFALVWQVFALNSSSPVIATFTETVAGLADLAFVSGAIWGPLLVSNQAMVLGFVAAIVVAIPWGLAAGRYRILDRSSDPYIAIFLAVPIAPLIPIVITALGLGLVSRVVMVFFFVFVFVAVNTRAGVRQVDRSLIEMATSFGATQREVWRMVVIPSALPAIFAGLRIGLGRAVSGMVLVELLMVASGIGRLLLQFSGRLQGDLMFGVVVAILLEALILLTAMRALERRLAPWAHDASV